jgi:hypothetical protein
MSTSANSQILKWCGGLPRPPPRMRWASGQNPYVAALDPPRRIISAKFIVTSHLGLESCFSMGSKAGRSATGRRKRTLGPYLREEEPGSESFRIPDLSLQYDFCQSSLHQESVEFRAIEY